MMELYVLATISAMAIALAVGVSIDDYLSDKYLGMCADCVVSGWQGDSRWESHLKRARERKRYREFMDLADSKAGEDR